MQWPISDSDYQSLFAAVVSALDIALRGSASSTEPQLVANLVWHLPRKINAVSLTRGFSVKSGGVFIHSRPLVTYDNFPDPSQLSIELGDLLLLRTGIQNNKITDRRAILLQAKKYDSLPVRPPDNKNQHHLYAHWPKFKYTSSSSALNGKTRRVSGLDIYNGAKYLLISKNYPNCLCDQVCAHNCHALNPIFHQTSAVTAQPSKPDLSHYQCFLVELIDFILGDAGKSYKAPPHWRNRNWDKVIEDLTMVTANRVSKYMQDVSAGASRARGLFLAFLSGSFPKGSSLPSFGNLPPLERHNNELNGSPEVPGEWSIDEGEDGGLSIVEFVVSTAG